MRDYVITSLAMLKVGWDHDEKVYSDYFVPFIVDCLQQQSEGKAAVAAIKAALKDAFMLDVAAGVINTVLRRAADKHLVHVQHGVYELTEAGRQLPALEPKRRTFLRGFNQIVSELRDYLEREHNIEWDVPQSEEALLNHVNYHASPILAAAIDGKDLPSISKRSSRTNYLVGGFVQHISANSNPLFELLVDLVKGSVLANVLCYPSLEKICKRLDGLTAVHDTKVLIKALGYDGQASRDVAVELISALKGLGVQNTFFDTTKAELVAILRATEGSLRHRPRLTEAHHSVLRTFVASGYRPSDVMERIVSLGDDLERAGLAELRRPAHQKELTLDESRLEELFAQEMSGRGHYTDKHDIDAITAIHRLRGGKRAIDIESCRALFVTTNPALVRVAHDFHDEMLGDGGFPYAMLDHRLATIAWLKQPRSAASELPRHMLIASCLAAMNPPDELWQRHVQETDRLGQRGERSDGQFDNLMYSTEGTRAQ